MIQSVSNQNPSLNNGNSNSNYMYVGPYRLEKTLGKGQTGLVKLGVHHKTGKKVAIKIVNREKLNESVLMKVEREITIMKLIEHNNVLRLYDVYDNKKYLYLILEHVSGGELFDYLVKKSRLTIKEAKKFFRQIISALDFCHSHLICHRDLKPENLLLDEKLNIKIADFGMASLQVDGSMLETSCGSPHYACPEVIRGEKYDGRKADVWSCGVILYALLVGALPFDDDNLKQLLEKIKKGHFTIPSYVPQECQELLRKMIEIDPNKRLSLEEVNKHPWVLAGAKEELELGLPMNQIVSTAIIPSRVSIDTDVLNNMTSLGCFKDSDKLIECLLNEKHNTEKVIYFLLLDRKLKNPCDEDNDEVLARSRTVDAPRKRIDKFKTSGGQYSQLTVGSPVVGRRGFVVNHGPRHQSCHTTPLQSPCTSPIVTSKDMFLRDSSQNIDSDNISISSNNSNNINQQIRSRINSFKITMFSAPKFYRPPDKQVPDSPNMSIDPGSKSWFQRWNFRQENINTAQPEQDREKEFTYVINDRPLNSVKADLIHAFLSTQDLIHNINSPSLFRCEYRSPEKFISRNVRFKVEILTENNNNASTTSNNINNVNTAINGGNNSNPTVLTNNININNNVSNNMNTDQSLTHQNPSYKILFTLLSGSTRQFHSLCKHICMLIGNNTTYTNSNPHHQRQARLHQQQLKQQQQMQMQHQSPKVTNNFSNYSSNNNNGSNNNNNNNNNTNSYPYHNTAPSTPIHNSSIPSAQSPMLQQSRNNVNNSNVSGGYVTACSPSISTPISRRNSNTSHPSSPSTSITTALGATTITASPFIHNKTPHYSNHNQNIQNSPLPHQPASPAPNNVNHSFNTNNNSNNQNSQNQYTNGNSHPHNRKNSTASLNSAQINLMAQFQQQQAPSSPMQQNNQNINNQGNIYNTPLLMNQASFGSNHIQQQNQLQHQLSNDPYAYSLNKHQILQEIYNLNNNDINVYNKD